MSGNQSHDQGVILITGFVVDAGCMELSVKLELNNFVLLLHLRTVLHYDTCFNAGILHSVYS